MSAVKAATRPTLRDIARAPWRFVAAIILVFLPMAAYTAMATYSESERQTVGSLDTPTTAYVAGQECVQNPASSSIHYCESSDDLPGPEYARVAAALPQGWSARALVRVSNTTELGGSFTQAPADVLEQALAPTPLEVPGPGEIILGRGLAEYKGVQVGDSVTVQFALDAAPQTLRVTGLDPGGRGFISEPTAVDPRVVSADEARDITWLLDGPGELSWDEVKRLNRAGIIVTSEHLRENPPPDSEVDPRVRDSEQRGAPDLVTIFVSVIALLLVACLGIAVMSPVFTIAIARQSTAYAMMSAQGATPGHIRLAVLTYGAVVGVAGVALGLLGGVALGAGSFVLRNPGWTPTLPGWPLAHAAGLCLLGCLAAAFLPAVLAARQALAASIAGARSDRILGWRWRMLGGPLLLLGGVGCAVAAWTAGPGIAPTSAAFLLLFVGAVASMPGLLAGLSRAAARLPLSPRLALRNATRQGWHTVPSVAALLAVASVGTLAAVGFQATQDRDEALAAATLRPEAVLFSQPLSPENVADITAILGPVAVHPIQTVTDDTLELEAHWTDNDSRVMPGGVGIIASPALLDAIAFPDAATRERARQALADGLLIAPQSTTGVSVVRERDQLPVLPTALRGPLLSAATADALGLQAEEGVTLVRATRPVSARDVHELRALRLGVAHPQYIPVFLGPVQVTAVHLAGLGLLAIVVVALVISVLTRAPLRRDFALLYAVGADPARCRRLAAWNAALLTALAAIPGVLLGYAMAVLNAAPNYHGAREFARFPWASALFLGVIAPLVAAAAGAWLHRNSTAQEYRLT